MRANNLTLLTDLYELTMMQGYFKTQPIKPLFLICFTGPIPAEEALPLQPDWNR